MKGFRSPRLHWLLILLATVLLAFIPRPASAQAQVGSQARIVRLSFVEGKVTMYRPDADEWSKVFVNTPIQQGFKLATGANSFAEVEFENGSTARLGQSSELDFTDLSLSPEGGKINRLILARGYATFTVMPERGDVYRVRAAGSTYKVPSKTMFRIDLGQGSQRLEVFKGDVRVQGPYGSGAVAHNQVLELTPGSADSFRITNGITEDAWDRWVDKRQHAETAAIKRAGSSSGPYAGSPFYGWSDLSYYGTWNFLPGYGSCWSPMMGAGWVPYSIGRWSWYPGFGYTWISGLSWGWLPFHYGSWIYPADVGWCWLPGNFSMWSPALVTWYQGPNWVSWSPMPVSRTYRKPPGFSRPPRCPSGQNCSVAVSNNTFQGGRIISPVDAMRVNPFRGRRVSSPTLPVTRGLRLPGPATDGPPPGSAAGTAVRPGFRLHHIRTVAPTHIFSEGAVHGAWNVRPHGPAVFDRQTQRFVNGSGSALQFLRENRAQPVFRRHGIVGTSPSGAHSTHAPAINNDVLLGGPRVRRRPGSRAGRVRGQLTPFPISNLQNQADALRQSRALLPSVRMSGAAAGMHGDHEPRMPNFHRGGFFGLFHSREKARTHREMRPRYRMPHQRAQRFPSGRRSTGGFGRGRSMGQPHGRMGGGMRRGGFGRSMGGGGTRGGMMSHGMGGGMHGGGGMSGGMHSGGMRSGGGGGGAHGRH